MYRKMARGWSKINRRDLQLGVFGKYFADVETYSIFISGQTGKLFLAYIAKSRQDFAVDLFLYKRGEDLVTIHTLRHQAYAIRNLRFEISLDSSTDMTSLRIRVETPEFPEVVQRRNPVTSTELPRSSPSQLTIFNPVPTRHVRGSRHTSHQARDRRHLATEPRPGQLEPGRRLPDRVAARK